MRGLASEVAASRALAATVACVITVGLAGVARADCHRIVGAKVHLPGGASAVTDVVLDGERVAAVGAGAGARPGCAEIAGQGMELTAGLIDPWSHLGLVGVELEGSTVDLEQTTPFQDGDHLVRAAVRGSLGYDARSIPIAVARLGGVTSTFVAPSGGLVAGQGFWVDLGEPTRAAAIRKDPAGMVASWHVGASRGAAASVLDLALREAALWETARPQIEKLARRDLEVSALDLEALGPVVRGEVPLVVQIDRAADIEALLELTAKTRVRLVLVGGAEAWMVAPALSARGVPVVVDPLGNLPSGFDALGARADNAALLANAGVPVLMSAFNPHHMRKLRQVAGNAVRAGLPWDKALSAITEEPAKAFGMTGYGRIEAGAVGDVVLWSGDPLEVSSRVVRVFVHGVDVPLRSRQTELLERYRHL